MQTYINTNEAKKVEGGGWTNREKINIADFLNLNFFKWIIKDLLGLITTIEHKHNLITSVRDAYGKSLILRIYIIK